ncbi:MAG TPA: salicylate synthase [Aldersonia sp.]
MSTTDEFLAPASGPTAARIERAVDPIAVATGLARSGYFAEYVGYERDGAWVFAAGVQGRVLLDRDELQVEWAGATRTTAWSGRPAQVVGAALEDLPETDRHALGWLAFESCAYALGAADRVPGAAVLAHLIVPRVEVRVDDEGVTVLGGDEDDHAAIRAVLDASDVRAPMPAALDIRSDPSGYRDRVATAIAEIAAGRYQKVILSRRVSVPFRLDMPATYRLGRTNNTPARSFLLRLGTLEAVGFSPELVAAVDAEGVVTTEPLAGTRAFGRGADEDLAARRELERDPKEIVEHAISVRTSVAEVESVAEPGSTAVTEFMEVRERGSVQHLASTVRGLLARGRSRWDAIDALFPSVTASGIPKRAGVDAVFRLDGPERGLYAGAVVSVAPDGGVEATLVLRAVYQQDGAAWLRAGAGVVGQSDPDREFEETCEKLDSVAPYLVPAD